MGPRSPNAKAQFLGERSCPGMPDDTLPWAVQNMAEPIEMPFGLWTKVDPRNHLLGGVHTGACLTNTTESSMCGGDVDLCQITLTPCYISRES